MATEEELIAAVARGDEAAFAALTRRWERPLFQFIHRHTAGRDVEDVYQETWLRVVGAARRFDPARRFSTWLFQIALNLCRDWHRAQRADPVDPDDLDRMPAGNGSLDRAIDARRLLAALPEPQREAVILRYFHDLGEDEAAEILGCPRGTVKSRLHHGLRKLMEMARR